MPRGIASFEKSNEAAKARRTQQGDYIRADFFSLQDGEMARVRFLEQGDDLTWAYCHRVHVGNSKWPQDLICLDQEDEGAPCPLCQSDSKDIRYRTKKGFLNLIWRGNEDVQSYNNQVKDENKKLIEEDKKPVGLIYKLAPLYKRNEKNIPEKDQMGNKIVTGFDDGIWLWKCTKTVFETIISKDNTYKGLMSRDFAILRQGAGKEDTKYFIEPADIDSGPQPMLVADMALMQNKYDLDALTKPESFENLAHKLAGVSTQYVHSSSDLPTARNDIFSGAPMRSSAFQK